jgi:threonine dehydrogenase-like Zn-dependent dehydrogenase
VVVRTCRCALCASDAHFLASGHTIVERSQKNNGPYAGVDLDKPIVMGHEYVGEILDYGPGSRRPLPTGTLVTSVPAVRTTSGFGIVGYYPECPGGYGEYMLLDEDLLLELPGDVDLDLAALVQPLAIGIEHARAGEILEGDIPLVLGCGAIGLSVIAGLRLQGVAPIVMGGYCLDPEEIYVPTAQNKRLRIHFAGGESPDDMMAARDAILEGQVDLKPWLGEGIGLSQVEDALNRMSDPAEPVRGVVDPSRL